MLSRFRRSVLVLCGLVFGLGLGANALAQDMLVVDRATLNQIISAKIEPVAIPSGTVLLTFKPNQPVVVDPFKFSIIPDICKYIIYGPDSPWVDICGHGATFVSGEFGLGAPSELVLSAARQNQANTDLLCKIVNCNNSFPPCPVGQYFDFASGGCEAPYAFVELCKGKPLDECPIFPKIKDIEQIFGPDCKDSICLPKDFLHRDAIWPLIDPNLKDRLVATQGKVITVRNAALETSMKGLSQNQFLILSR